MPKKAPAPPPPTRKTGWTVFVYYLDYDENLREIVQVREFYAADLISAQLLAADVKVRGVTISDGSSFRMVPTHRVSLIVYQDTRG